MSGRMDARGTVGGIVGQPAGRGSRAGAGLLIVLHGPLSLGMLRNVIRLVVPSIDHGTPLQDAQHHVLAASVHCLVLHSCLAQGLHPLPRLLGRQVVDDPLRNHALDVRASHQKQAQDRLPILELLPEDVSRDLAFDADVLRILGHVRVIRRAQNNDDGAIFLHLGPAVLQEVTGCHRGYLHQAIHDVRTLQVCVENRHLTEGLVPLGSFLKVVEEVEGSMEVNSRESCPSTHED
mmetsp:Transcript_87218/g.241901  ORF Transcript_87218/g.241901 Transcript_87218/m.241901 type:complete len:235 (+) Transcript_87218:98-802(+)